MKKKRIRTVLVLLLVILGIYLGITGIRSYLDLTTYRKQVADITISRIDMSRISDGSYTGSCEILWVAAEVRATVKDHKITGIELLEHKNERGTAAEVIPDKVVEAQSLQVDMVSGATSSSKVILKAIENALNSAPKD